jgi:hypothetical protein
VPFLPACWCTTALGRAQGFTWSDYRALIIIASHRQLARCWWCWDNLNIHLAFPGRKVGDVAASAGRKRVRRMVIGRTKTEMKAKFRDLRRDLDSGAGPA